MSDLETEKQLLSRLRQGDESAFRTLFDQYYKTILLTANHLIKDQNLAQDVTQDVFVALWKNREKLPDPLNLPAYLKRAAINKSLNFLQSRKHHIGAGPEPLQHLKEKDNPEKSQEATELKQVVQNCIDELPPRCRTIYILKRNEGLSHDEISEQLGISKKTIENQMTKALKSLKQAVLNYQKDLTNKKIHLLLWGILLVEWFCL